MGRIDEALRRANLDVSQGTGAHAPVPERPPWRFDQREGDDGHKRATPPPIDGTGGVWSGACDALERLVTSDSAPPLLVEQFRSLAATLIQIQGEQPLKSIIVTSPSPGDGKTQVAVNLALTLAVSYGKRILLIDADLRRPALHTIFGIPAAGGLSAALTAKADEKVGTVQVTGTLTVLPAGRPEPNPLGGLSSDRMKRIVLEAASRFDWVIVDSPPVGVLADGRLVSEAVDGAIVVVRAGVTPLPDLIAAADIIGRDRILGLVLNGVDQVEIRGEEHYRRYYRGETAHNTPLHCSKTVAGG